MMQKMPKVKPIIAFTLISLFSLSPAFANSGSCGDIVEANSLFNESLNSSRNHSAHESSRLESNDSAVTLKMTGDKVLIDQVRVTGKEYSVIEFNLDLNPEVLLKMRTSGGQVLSVGEGVSELLPELLRMKIHAKGLDLWYHSENLNEITDDPEVKKMQAYQAKYGAHLIRGDALQMPLPSESQTFVLSHLLINNLHIAERLKFLAETFRVLKVGGEARILMDDSRNPNLSPTYVKAIVDFIETNYTGAIDFELDRSLLTAKKQASIRKDFKPKIPFNANLHYDNVPMGAREFRDNEDKKLFAEIAQLTEILRRDPENIKVHDQLEQLLAKRNSARVVELHDND